LVSGLCQGRTPLLKNSGLIDWSWHAMTLLMITDIRKSSYDSGSEILTAVFLDGGVYDGGRIKSLDEKAILALESATANEDLPAIGVHRGDQYIRLRANPGHGLMVGEWILLDEREGA